MTTISTATQLSTDTDFVAHCDETYKLYKRWLDWRAQNKDGLRASSIASYSTRLKVVAEFFAMHKVPLVDCTEDLLDRMLQGLKSESANRARYLTLIQELLDFHVYDAKLDKSLINKAPTRLRVSSKYKEALTRSNTKTPTVLSPSARQAFIRYFNNADGTEGDWTGVRNRAMFALMLGAGLKPVETVAVTKGDLLFDSPADADRGLVYALSLRGHGLYGPRQTQVADYARQCLSEWLLAALPMGLIPTDQSVVFPSSRTLDTIDRTGLYRAWDELMGKLGLVAYTPHMMRNTWIVANMQNLKGKDLEEFCNQTGMAHPDSLARYRNIVRSKFTVI